jgi:phage shock protein E
MFGSPKVPEITPEKVQQAIENKSDVVIVDVRTPEEYAKGHIVTSKLVPIDELQAKIADVIPDANATVYVYCFSGSRSAPAVQYMLSAGYKNAFHMPSGLLAWRHKGYALTQD